MTNDLLFVYGTLLISDNEFARYLTGNSTHYCAGKVKGKLYDVGHYPALVIGNTDNYDISGTVYRLHDADAVLKYLDPYEGYGEGEELPYLFIREAVEIETEQGTLTCWIYLYNRSIEGLRVITSGNYLDYLKRS